MKRKNVRILGLILSFMIISMGFSGFSLKKTSKSADNTPITFTMFDKNTGDAFDDPVAREITKRTGVKLEIQQPTGNPLEKLNLMLASGDMSDMVLMDRGNDIVNKYTSSGALVPLNDLIDKYGPNIKKMYGNTLKMTKYSDGKNYYLSNWYGADPSPVFGVLMRKDLLKEAGAGAKINNGKPFTTIEFESILKAVKAKHPKLNGHDIIPLTLWAENMGAITGTFKGMWGMKSYYEDKGNLKYDVKDPKYLEMLKYINRLFTEGLIDKEWATSKKQLWEQKISNGYTFSTVGAYWDIGNDNALLKKTNIDSQLYSYKVVAPGVNPAKTTFGPRSSLGWDAIAITKNCKDPVRAIKFMDYLASEEGQYLLMWGIEGKDWTKVKGKHTPNPEILKAFTNDWDGTKKKTGIRRWTYFVKNGNGSDGTPYDLVPNYKKDDVTALAFKNLQDSVWDTAPYDNLGPAGGTPEALLAQKITDLINQAIPEIINCPNEAAVVARYNKMMSDLNKSGIDTVEKIINDNYQKRMQLWKK